MATACPNIHSKEWKQLMDQVQNERLAELAFIAKGYRIPNVRPITEIKKAIGFNPLVEDFTRIAAKLKRYNRINGTSHRFEKELVYGNTFRLTMKYNYLSVNQEEQRQRDARYDRTLRIPGWDNFDYGYYDAKIEAKEKQANKEKEINNISKRDINFYRGDIALMEQEEDDYMIPSAPKQITQIEYIRNKKISKEINNLHSKLRIETNPEKAYKLHNQLEVLKTSKTELTERIAKAKNIETYEAALITAYEQLEDVRNLINKNKLTDEEIVYGKRVLSLWLKAGDFSGNSEDHPILDEDEFNTPEIRNEFRDLRKVAEELDGIIFKKEKENVLKFVKENTDNRITAEQVFSPLHDKSKVNTLTTSIGKQADPMLQAIHAAVERKNMEVHREASELWENIDDLAKKVIKKSNNFLDFRQVDEFGRFTDRIVTRFSAAFYAKRHEMMEKAFHTYEKGKVKKTKATIDAYYKWVAENTINFDYRLLFPDSSEVEDMQEYLFKEKSYSEKEKQAHLAELKTQLGEKGFEFYQKQVQKKLEKFQIAREAELLRLKNDPTLSKEEIDSLFTTWNKENSPYWVSELQEKPGLRKKGKSDYYSPKFTYMVQVPRRYIEDKETIWYDEKYQKIEADTDMYEFHNLFVETLNTLGIFLPEHQKSIMSYGVIPFMEKTVMDQFSEKGMMMGVTPFFDMIKSMATTTDQSTEIHSDVDPSTGVLEKEHQIQFVKDNRAAVQDRVRILALEHKQKTGIPATATEMQNFKSIAKNEIASKQSFDLVKVLKAYSLSVLSHKHQAEISPIIKLTRNAFAERGEIVTNKAGKAQKRFGKIQTTPGVQNLLSSLDYYLDTDHFQIGGRKIEGVQSKIVLTSGEKKTKKQLEAILEKETDETVREFIEEQINMLGSNLTVSGMGDVLLKIQNLRGMGWNIRAAFSNIAFGVISNIIQGSGNDLFLQKNLRKGYILCINSVVKNNTFGMVDSPNKTGTKIRALMDKYNLLQSIKNETFQSSTASTFNKLKAFGPMTLSERTEYLNQAPIMIAVMMDFKAKNDKGEEIPLWEAMGPNGELKEGFTTDVDEIKMAQKIKKIIEINHGDYGNPLQVKENLAGRALSQFRTWMFEGFKNRFREEEDNTDYILSYGMKEGSLYKRKGRYRSYTPGQLMTTGAVVGSTFLPGIGTVVGGALGAAAGKFFSTNKTEESIWVDALFTAKQLVRKLYTSTQFGDKFNETDAANMRKNMTELYILVTLSAIAILIKAGMDDDDEDKKIAIFLLNQSNRLMTDINFYTSPVELEGLTKTAVPASDLIFDINTWRKDAINYLNDDEEDDIFKSGPFEDYSKVLIHGLELFPGSSQAISTIRSVNTVVKK